MFMYSISKHRRDDCIATAEFPLTDAVDGVNSDVEMFDADGNSVGTVAVSISFEEGDVNFFELLGSALHKDD